MNLDFLSLPRLRWRQSFSPAEKGLTTIRVRSVEPKELSDKTIVSLQRAGVDPTFVDLAERQLHRAH